MSSYLSHVLQPGGTETAAERVARVIEKSGVRYSVVAFTGTSGALVAPLVAQKLGKWPVVVHKAETRRHAYGVPVEGRRGPFSYVIVDDFIDTGATVKRVVAEIRGAYPRSRCAGVFLYGSSGCTVDMRTKKQQSEDASFPLVFGCLE